MTLVEDLCPVRRPPALRSIPMLLREVKMCRICGTKSYVESVPASTYSKIVSGEISIPSLSSHYLQSTVAHNVNNELFCIRRSTTHPPAQVSTPSVVCLFVVCCCVRATLLSVALSSFFCLTQIFLPIILHRLVSY